MSENRKIGLFLMISGILSLIFLFSFLMWDCGETERQLPEIEQTFIFPDSTCFSANKDTLYFFANDTVFALPLPQNFSGK